MQNRRAADSMKSTIDAAALQADMARRFNLPGSATRKVKQITSAPMKKSSYIASNSSTASTTSSSSSSSSSASASAASYHIYCVSCRNANSQSAQICSTCGYFLTSAQHHSAPSLAEMRGLVAAAPKVEVMIDSEWDIVEGKLAGNNMISIITFVVFFLY